MSVKVKKFPIIGGPLDGQFANQADFYTGYNREAGQFVQYADEYLRFNSGDGKSPASMLFLYKPLVVPSIKDWQTPLPD